MANKQIPLTNRKLAYSRRQYQLVVQSREQGDVPAASCALEASWLFLHQAYLSLLQEIAEAYRHNGEPVQNLQHLRKVLADRGLQPAELNSLERLEDSPSWLSDLIKAQQLLLSTDNRGLFRVEPAEEQAPRELVIIDVTQDQSDDWCKKLDNALICFEQLLVEIRDTIAEY